ncbi:HAMP domain-containing histidine kinase [bacterium]|nr:HAMP domain-containing histidine kinase [bacterium]
MKNDIKEEFISTLSHEIRTPLTSIKGFCSTMLSSWEVLDDNKKKEFLNIILSQSNRLIGLVENVLNVAKIDSNSSDLVFVKVNAKELMQNCINIVAINYKNFEFNFKKPANTFYCLIDNNKSQQILINILDNAAKYSKNSNKIDIKIFEKDDKIVFSIKNYGSYINEEDRKQIFNKFFRAQSYISSTTQGSGLGLYIAKNLAQKMNGDILVTSNEEKNETEFLIYLPVFEIEKMTKCIKQEF